MEISRRGKKTRAPREDLRIFVATASDAHLCSDDLVCSMKARSLGEGSQGALDYLLIFLTLLVIAAVAAFTILSYERMAENRLENAENLR